MGEMKKREETLNTLLQNVSVHMRGDALFCIMSLPKRQTCIIF
jgi:hypothetical protein